MWTPLDLGKGKNLEKILSRAEVHFSKGRRGNTSGGENLIRSLDDMSPMQAVTTTKLNSTNFSLEDLSLLHRKLKIKK